MANTHEMLRDRGTYPDSMVITAPNGQTTTMGEFRAVFFERQRELDQQAAALGKGRMELAEVFQGLMAEKERVTAREAELNAARAGVAAEWNGDAAGAADRLASLEANISETRAALDKVTKQMDSASQQYVFDRMREDFDGEALPAGVTEADVIKHAQNRNLKRGYLPDVKAALRDLRAPAILEDKIKKAEQVGYERAQSEIALRAINGNSRTVMPGQTKVPVEIKPSMGTDEIIEAATAAAATDQDIRGMLAGVIPAPGA